MQGTIGVVKTISVNLDKPKEITVELSKNKTVSAELSNKKHITGSLNKINTLEANIEKDKQLTANLSAPSYVSDIYFGEYEVVPSQEEKTLATNNKILKGDVSIKQIPYHMTSNETGYTVYIGGE